MSIRMAASAAHVLQVRSGPRGARWGPVGIELAEPGEGSEETVMVRIRSEGPRSVGSGPRGAARGKPDSSDSLQSGRFLDDP